MKFGIFAFYAFTCHFIFESKLQRMVFQVYILIKMLALGLNGTLFKAKYLETN